MIVVELAFTDTPERRVARPAHRDLLGTLQATGQLLAAGPWADDSGALLVFTGDRDAVDAVMRDDPYYTTEGVTVTAIRTWQPVVGP